MCIRDRVSLEEENQPMEDEVNESVDMQLEDRSDNELHEAGVEETQQAAVSDATFLPQVGPTAAPLTAPAVDSTQTSAGPVQSSFATVPEHLTTLGRFLIAFRHYNASGDD